MFEQTFKNIDNVLHKDAGSDSELDSLEASFQKKLTDLNELKKSILQKAFAGKWVC